MALFSPDVRLMVLSSKPSRWIAEMLMVSLPPLSLSVRRALSSSLKASPNSLV